MEIDVIAQKLKQQFSAPLPDFYTRRIVFWHDEEGSFSEMVDSLEIPNVKLLKLTGSNNFYAKMLLSAEDTQSNYLVYDPIIYDDIRENWLLDIECYSEEFRADLVSMQMEQYSISQTVTMRKETKHYAKFFASQARGAKLQAFGNSYATAWALRLDILAVLVGTQDHTPAGILRAVLSDDMEENKAWELIEKFGDPDHFWELAPKYAGYDPANAPNLADLSAHLLLTALTDSMPPAFFRGLEGFVSEGYQQNCVAFVHEWLHSDQDDAYLALAREIEERFDLPSRFQKQDVRSLLECEIFPCVNECILAHYLTATSENRAKPGEILSVVEKRRAMKWFDRVKNYYDGIWQIAQMQIFLQQHADGFHVGHYDALWNAYQKELYPMDTAYRHFHTAFSASLRQSNLYLEDLFKTAADHVEMLYKNWYLKNLSAQWLLLTDEEFSAESRLDGIAHQREFFGRYVSPLLSSGSRVFVIISDAMRYEVGAQLANALTQETKGQTKLDAMASALPSVTKFGMSALLPHTRMELTEDGQILCDGFPTDGTENREKILRLREKNSIAVTYKNLLAMKKAEKRELISGKDLVYIYHNAIDTVGEARATEDQVFSACANAIEELKNLVRIITNELNGTNILLTADHGFLYTYQPLESYEKVETASVSSAIYERDRRYMLAERTSAGAHLLTIPMAEYHSDSVLLIPRETCRFKAGGGMNYVHGGVTLQEMMIPVITFKNLRATSKQYEENRKATISLISSGRKICNNVFSLDFYQKEEVCGKVAPTAYEVYFTDAMGKTISNVKTILADKTDPAGENRVTRMRFTLNGQNYQKTEEYFLTVQEKGGAGIPEKVPFSIDIAFTNDFDF